MKYGILNQRKVNFLVKNMNIEFFEKFLKNEWKVIL